MVRIESNESLIVLFLSGSMILAIEKFRAREGTLSEGPVDTGVTLVEVSVAIVVGWNGCITDLP